MTYDPEKHSNLFEEMKDGKVGTKPVNTAPTPAEEERRGYIKRQEARIAQLEADLKKEQGFLKASVDICAKEGHRVRFDEPSWIYDNRWCYVCGASCGLI